MSDPTAADTLATPTPCALTLLRCLVVLDSATLPGGRMVADEAPRWSPAVYDAPEEDAVSFAADVDAGGETGYAGRVARLDLRGDADVLLSDVLERLCPCIKRFLSASVVLAPLTERPPLGLPRSSELVDLGESSVENRRCQLPV